MPSTTIRISEFSRKMLRELAREEGKPLQLIVDQAIENYRRRRFLEGLSSDFAALRNDVEGWKCEEEERKNRFDIKINGTFETGKEFSVVIEAKINAEEGEDQLKRYEELCSLSTKLVFLTPDGREPKTTKNKNRWKFISWQQIAINLLRFMESFKDKAEKPEGFHFLKYFTAAIIREIDGAGMDDNPINLISYINKLKKERTND